MAEIDLLSKEREKTGESKTKTIGTLILAILVGLSILGTFSLLGYQSVKKHQIDNLESQISDLKKEEQNYGNLETEATTLQKQLNNLRNLLTNKTSYSSFLVALASSTSKNVQYTNLTIEEDGTTELAGYTPNYASLAQLIVNLKKAPILDAKGQPITQNNETVKLFEDVELTSATREAIGKKKFLKFNLKLSLNKGALRETR